jgi:hypothetical protein
MILELLKRNLETYQWFLKTIQKLNKFCIYEERNASFQVKFFQQLHHYNLSPCVIMTLKYLRNSVW